MNYRLKGLYVITDQKLIPRDKFTNTVEKTIKGGAKLIQLREKNTPEEEIVNLGKELLSITKKYGIPLLINDSPALAKEIGADGVHLGEYDPPVSEARKLLGEGAIIGVSCYGKVERGIRAEKEGADYAAFGSPFSTPTKPHRISTPLEILKEAKKRITRIPIFAVGGINMENALSVLETGVDGIAVITSVFGSSDPEKSARELASLFVNT